MATPSNTNFDLGSVTVDPNTNKVYQLSGTQNRKAWVLQPATNARTAKSRSSYVQWSAAAPNAKQQKANTAKGITIKPTTTPSSRTLRYPSDSVVNAKSDFVYFEFGKYQPPFARDSVTSANTEALDLYNASATAFQPDPTTSLLLPMPQDLSTENINTWQGKSFTSIGRAAVAAIGAGNFSNLADLAKNSDIWTAFKTAIDTAGLNKIPGVGGNLGMNDISGSTRGIILNPNAEVLYEAPNLRELGMVFKMVPQSQTDADNILKICQIFRFASSPSYGVTNTDLENFIDPEASQGSKNAAKGVNFIHVPKLCKFTFMTGSETNKKIPQYKPCAITRVEVNYTPDGTYATYSDGTPVAIELSLRFMETKIIFAEEIKLSGESF